MGLAARRKRGRLDATGHTRALAIPVAVTLHRLSMLLEFADTWMMRTMLLNLRERAEGRTPIRSDP
jgi:hypothetical protein